MPADYDEFKESAFLDVGTDGLEVFEVWWESTARYPTYTPSRRLAIAERVVGELLAEGRVRLFREAPIGGAMEAVADKDVAAALNAWMTWSQDGLSVSLRRVRDGEEQGEAKQL